MQAIDGALLALTLGATFVARSFSGDKAQLVPIIQAGLAPRGFAFIDIISPCVTFNDHGGSKELAEATFRVACLLQARDPTGPMTPTLPASTSTASSISRTRRP